MNVCFTNFVFNFLNHISNLIHRRIEINLETKLCQKVRQFCFNVLRDFVLKIQKLPRLSDVRSFPNCRRSAFLRFVMVSAQSSLIHGLPGCFGFVEVFEIVSSAIDITLSLNFKIGSVSFWIISNWSFSPHICSHWGQFALSNLYRVGLSHTVRFKLSRIMGKWSPSQRSSWTFQEKSRRRDGLVTVRSIVNKTHSQDVNMYQSRC